MNKITIKTENNRFSTNKPKENFTSKNIVMNSFKHLKISSKKETALPKRNISPTTREYSPKNLNSKRNVYGTPSPVRNTHHPTIRSTIFKDHDDSPLEERHYIIPRGERTYAILLILTDGKLDDMIETKNILVQASNYPISVIIVGVGDGHFGNINELRKIFIVNKFIF